MYYPSDILRLFPSGLADALRACRADTPDVVEEIRCRVDRPATVLTASGARRVEGAVTTGADLDALLERAAEASLHTYAEELRRGFLHTSSGCRIGICGSAYCRDGALSGIRQISSVSVRIPHEVHGCADAVFPALTDGGFQSTLLLSPPGFGKTTLLRELIRRLSESGLRISVADERGEIAAVHDRAPRFDLGPNTDVMTGGAKGESCMLLLRAMNPQLLAFDEITAASDIAAVEAAAGCGVELLATAHAENSASMRQRALYRELLSSGIFKRAVWIRREGAARRYAIEAL